MLNLALPQPEHTRLTLHLFSDLEGRVPLGAYQRFFSERINDFFAQRHLDLAPWTGGDPGAVVVSGSEEALNVLRQTLIGVYTPAGERE
jgi:hypothetical protein